ncbi:MAG TPA: sterol desaturase family protein [Pseudomonadales bacterium]|nr:sterol desaturase family protein [Pseudomonadales bacterium]
MNALLKKFWNFELANISERYRPWVSAFVVFFTAMFFVQFPLLFHIPVYLGPGLGDEQSTRIIRELIFDRLVGADAVWGWGMGILLLITLSFRAWVMLGSYFGYERTFGHKFPLHIIVIMILVNAVGALSIPVVLAALGLLLKISGGDFNDGWLFIEHVVIAANQWVMINIPTVIELNPWIAVLLVFQMAGFVHYWLHRLGHQSRALWMLFHRQHHVSPNLSQFSTAAVFFAFPLFIVFVVPYVFIFAAITKLFSAVPLYREVFFLNTIFMFAEIIGHSDVFYEWAVKRRWISWPGFVFGGGVYHYLHHSAERTDAVASQKNYKVNMVNMGGGLCFLWDKMFGTYAPLREKKPVVGLTGQPLLYYNPFRLALGGLMQLLYELRHNKSWRIRVKILFGDSYYTPPVTHSYILKSGVEG